MSDSWCKHEGKKVLLVEGPNDCHVILALCARYKLPETFGIYECGSDSKAIRRLNALISSPEPPQVIGLVIEADRPDMGGRWSEIRAWLAHYNYVFSNGPAPEGTVIEPVNEVSRLGFWLMPNNRDSGMLEDFCIEMIDAAALNATRECIEFANTKEITTFKPTHYSKAIMHTYLALQDEPRPALGASHYEPNSSFRHANHPCLHFLAGPTFCVRVAGPRNSACRIPPPADRSELEDFLG